MANALNEIIKKLEQQRTAIERALAALREVDGPAAEAVATTPASAGRAGRKAKRKGGMTPEGRKRLSDALRARWAAKRAGSAVPAAKATAKTAAKRKGGMTPEGRERLSAALRQRWAAKRAAAKKAARK